MNEQENPSTKKTFVKGPDVVPTPGGGDGESTDGRGGYVEGQGAGAGETTQATGSETTKQ